MEEDSSDSSGVAGSGDPRGSPRFSTHKGKSCKGCLYYSSLFKADARKPMCVGISRTLHKVPGYFVGETEMEATKEGRNLSDFKYACVGYSVFLDSKDDSSEKQENRAELPFCAGLELFVTRLRMLGGRSIKRDKSVFCSKVMANAPAPKIRYCSESWCCQTFINPKKRLLVLFQLLRFSHISSFLHDNWKENI